MTIPSKGGQTQNLDSRIDALISTTHHNQVGENEMNVFRMMVCNRIRMLAAFHDGSNEGQSSMRWSGTKELLYELVNGPFQPTEKNSTRKKKYVSIDLTTFNYETLDDTSLLMMYELVVRRAFVQM